VLGKLSHYDINLTPICKRLSSPGIDSASLCSMADRYAKYGCRTGPQAGNRFLGSLKGYKFGLCSAVINVFFRPLAAKCGTTFGARRSCTAARAAAWRTSTGAARHSSYSRPTSSWGCTASSSSGSSYSARPGMRKMIPG
jgi:hypothetical protein